MERRLTNECSYEQYRTETKGDSLSVFFSATKVVE